MRAKISRSRLVSVITKWLDHNYGHLHQFVPEPDPNSIYLFDSNGSVIFAYMKVDQSLFVRGSLFSFIHGMFYLDYTNYLSKDILKKWLWARYGIKINGPIDLFNPKLSIIGEIEDDIKTQFKLNDE